MKFTLNFYSLLYLLNLGIFTCKQVVVKDHWLVLFVIGLAVIDVLILGSYTATEWSRDQLGVKSVPNKENPQDVIGVKVYHTLISITRCSTPQIYMCVHTIHNFRALNDENNVYVHI